MQAIVSTTMLCSPCIRFLEDKTKVDHNIRDILQFISEAKSLQDSVHKIARLAMLNKHFKKNTKVLEDLILILSVNCQDCGRQN